MTYEISIEQKSDYLHVTVTGENSEWLHYRKNSDEQDTFLRDGTP